MSKCTAMFTKSGNKKVDRLVKKLKKLPDSISDDKLYDKVVEGLEKIENQDHLEVWDTSVREHIIGELEQEFNRELTIYWRI